MAASGSKRCDAKCHNARHEKCECWCAGRYHGIGSDAARIKILNEFGRVVKPGRGVVDPEVEKARPQGSMFD